MKKSVLIVDDTTNFRQSLAASLRREGFDVLCAANGEEALRFAESNSLSVILLDIGMPKKDGLSCLEALRKSDANKETPVIMLTARADQESVIRAKTLGIDSYLLKASFSTGELVDRIHKIIGPTA